MWSPFNHYWASFLWFRWVIWEHSLLSQLPVFWQSVRHWQRGSTPWLSVKRRRNLATVADCGVSQCSLTRPGVANVLLSSNFQIIVSQCYLIFTTLRPFAIGLWHCFVQSVSQIAQYGSHSFSMFRKQCFAVFCKWALHTISQIWSFAIFSSQILKFCKFFAMGSCWWGPGRDRDLNWQGGAGS